jgi:hypothetical protein
MCAETHEGLHVTRPLFFVQIDNKIGMDGKIPIKSPNNNFHENSLSGSLVVSWVHQTDMRAEGDCNRAICRDSSMLIIWWRFWVLTSVLNGPEENDDYAFLIMEECHTLFTEEMSMKIIFVAVLVVIDDNNSIQFNSFI